MRVRGLAHSVFLFGLFWCISNTWRSNLSASLSPANPLTCRVYQPETVRDAPSPKGHGTNYAQRRIDLFGCIHQARCEAGVGNPVRCSARHDLVLEQSFDYRLRLHSVHIKAD